MLESTMSERRGKINRQIKSFIWIQLRRVVKSRSKSVFGLNTGFQYTVSFRNLYICALNNNITQITLRMQGEINCEALWKHFLPSRETGGHFRHYVTGTTVLASRSRDVGQATMVFHYWKRRWFDLRWGRNVRQVKERDPGPIVTWSLQHWLNPQWGKKFRLLYGKVAYPELGAI